MATIIGPTTLKDIVVQTGVDTTLLSNYKTTAGVTFDTIVGQLRAGLAGISNDVMGGVYSGLVYVSDDMLVEYTMGGGAVMEHFTENARAQFQRGQVDGHMLPLMPYDIGMGWTWRYLEKANPSRIQSDIQVVLNAVRNRYRISILQRLLKRSDDTGAILGLGTSGISPGFATTAASTGVDFTPPDWNGTSFLSTHEHYAATADSGSIVIASVKAMRAHLTEHGHTEPFDMWISNDDRAVWTALSGFYTAIDPNINLAAATATSIVTMEQGYIGYVEGFRVRVMPGMPNNYAFGFKSYGPNNPKNPIQIRVPEGKSGLDLRLLTDGANESEPLKGAYVFTEFGVGVGQDRTNGIPSYSNSGTWTDGVAT